MYVVASVCPLVCTLTAEPDRTLIFGMGVDVDLD